MSENILKVTNIKKKSFAGVRALKGVNLEIKKREKYIVLLVKTVVVSQP